MACDKSPFLPFSSNHSIQPNEILFQVAGAALQPLLTNEKLAEALEGLYCSAGLTNKCYGICPNADLAGVGVRSAFWISSIMQAFLVAISPEDSPQAAWTAVLLTAGVTIPAFIKKRNRDLTVYHATLILNFATFSSIVSLAVAPMCTIWRQQSTEPTEEPRDIQNESDDNGVPVIEVSSEQGGLAEDDSEPSRRKVHRQRLMMSLALLTQVALQWSWVIILFTDSEYKQKVCNAETVVLIFGKPLLVGVLNHRLFLLWPMWLLFNLLITLIWAGLLVNNSSADVHPVLSRQSSRVAPDPQTQTWRDKLQLPVDRGRIMVLVGNIMAFGISVLFLVSSEVQVGKNCVLEGENKEWSFGQIAALLIALTPMWPICVALEKWYNDSRNSPDNCKVCGSPVERFNSLVDTAASQQVSCLVLLGSLHAPPYHRGSTSPPRHLAELFGLHFTV